MRFLRKCGLSSGRFMWEFRAVLTHVLGLGERLPQRHLRLLHPRRVEAMDPHNSEGYSQAVCPSSNLQHQRQR